MSATIANALKQRIETAGLGLSAYRDAAPTDQIVPFVTIDDGIIFTPEGYDDGGRDSVGIQTVQVDLWEAWRGVDGEPLESPTLADRLVRVLHGARLDSAPARVYGVSVLSRRRLLEPEASGATYRGLVHTAITATINRML